MLLVGAALTLKRTSLWLQLLQLTGCFCFMVLMMLRFSCSTAWQEGHTTSLQGRQQQHNPALSALLCLCTTKACCSNVVIGPATLTQT
jgi:hypothetical protein